MDIVTLIDLAGSVALLLWGVHMVQTGVLRTLGARLNAIVSRALGNRVKAFMTGLGVTALLQSSTATGLMITGFAAGGVVDLVPAMAVMLGANVGTTLIVQVLSFDVSRIAPLFVLIGVVMFRRADGNIRDAGRIFIGLGLILIALHQFLEILQPYTTRPDLRSMLTFVSTFPVLDVFLGAALTWLMHSSVAMVILVTSFATHNVIPADAALAFVLGANVGTAINPVLEGGAKNPAERRLPVGNLLNRIAGVCVTIVFLDPITRFMAHLIPDVARCIADFHTFFNLILAVLLLPFLNTYARFLKWLLPSPQKEEIHDPSKPLYLDRNLLTEAPSIAISNATREALRLCDTLNVMIENLYKALNGKSFKNADTKRLDEVVDKLSTSIRAYLIRLDQEAINKEDSFKVDQILAFCTQLANAGDMIDRNILPAILKMNKLHLSLPEHMLKPVMTMIRRTRSNLQIAASLLINENEAVARKLTEQKDVFRNIEAQATADYYRALRNKNSSFTQKLGTFQLDLLRDLKRANTYVIASAAYPVLDHAGILLPNRLGPERSADESDDPSALPEMPPLAGAETSRTLERERQKD